MKSIQLAAYQKVLLGDVKMRLINLKQVTNHPYNVSQLPKKGQIAITNRNIVDYSAKMKMLEASLAKCFAKGSRDVI